MHNYYKPLYFIKYASKSKGFFLSIVCCLITQTSLADEYKSNKYTEYDIDYSYSFLNFYNPDIHESPSIDKIILNSSSDTQEQKNDQIQAAQNLSQDLNPVNTTSLEAISNNNFQDINNPSSIAGIDLVAQKIKSIDFNFNNLVFKKSIINEETQTNDFSSTDKSKSDNIRLLEAINRNTKSVAGFLQKGMASWYGKAFHGKKTASGNKFNMYAYTAAHRTLPLGSYVKVTNPSNKKTAIVKITDRGPYAHSRVIDLSFAAAKSLDMLNRGTANVQVEKLD